MSSTIENEQFLVDSVVNYTKGMTDLLVKSMEEKDYQMALVVAGRFDSMYSMKRDGYGLCFRSILELYMDDVEGDKLGLGKVKKVLEMAVRMDSLDDRFNKHMEAYIPA